MFRIIILLALVNVCVGDAIKRTAIRNVTAPIKGDDLEEKSRKPVCHYTDPNVADCIKRVAEQARELLAHGIPAFGIQPLEPLTVPSIRLRQHNMPHMRFKYDAWLSDVSLRGLTNYTFNKLDVYPEQLKVTANISLPHLLMAGEYVVIGEFQMLPVESTGKMAANFSECTIGLEALGAKVHKRIVIRDANVKLKCTGTPDADLMEAHSTTGEMEMITDHIIHMHATDIAKEVQPAVETALAMVLEDVANKFLKLGGFTCPRDDKAMGRCLRDALNIYIPQLTDGLPEYDVPPCEPLLIPTLRIQQTAGPVSITSTFSDVVVRGPSSMRVKDVKVNSKKHQIFVTLYIPELRAKGDYKLMGKLLMLPIDGQGRFTAKYGDIDAIVSITLGRRPRDNAVDALSCENLSVKFHVGYASMDLDDLFEGDDELNNTINKFLNDNWQKLIDELQSPIEIALREFLKPLADHAFATLDADDILL
ncbi:uncharacterized protein [Epargyreus clarus]|uniref:uncharacterized protein n=1 Tax=Epargyreus clarus TaxID=520877 RepID=UPI003C2AE2D8